MWMIEQLGGTTDPVFAALGNRPIKSTVNENDLARWPHRPAVKFLEDIIQRFKSLAWIPGGFYDPDTYPEFNGLKEIYLAAGWPETFDPNKFDRLFREYEEAEDLYREQSHPLTQLEIFRQWNERDASSRDIEGETTAREDSRAVDPKVRERWIKETTRSNWHQADWEQKWTSWYEASVPSS
jgi:hypothetical protein